MTNYLSRFSSLICVTIVSWAIVTHPAFAQQTESKETLLEELANTRADTEQRLDVLVRLVKFCWRSCAPEAKAYGQQAQLLLEKLPDAEQEALLLVYLPRVYQRDGDYQQALTLVERGLLVARELGDPHTLASIQFNQAMLYGDKRQFILAENAYQQLYQTYKELGNANGMGSALNNLGLINRRLHNYGKALEQYQQALKIYESGNVIHNMANTLGNIGQVYSYLKDYEMAEKSILRAKDMINIQAYPGIYASINGRLADVYMQIGAYEKATSLILENLSVSQQSQVRLADPDSFATLVNIELMQNNLDQAEVYYQQGLASYEHQTLADSYLALDVSGARLRVAQNRLPEAEALIADVVESVESGHISDAIMDMLNELIEVKKALGKWQEASELQSLYSEKYKEHVRHNRESRLEQFNILYKASENERLIAELERQNNQKSIEVLKADAQRRLIIFVAALVAIALFVVIYLGIHKRKLLTMKTDLLQADAEKKTRLFSDISHELRTPLSVLKLQVEGLEHDLVDDPKQTYELMQAKLTSINHLISDISQLALADAGELSLGFEPVLVREYFSKWCIDAASLANEKGLEFDFDIDLKEDDVCYMDPERIKQVLNNLLSNSCRYTDAPGKIEFKASISRGNLHWFIQDSSPGLLPEQLEQIFERLYRVDKSRSRKSGGSGLGLSICKSLVEAHHGTISAKQSDLGGVCVHVAQKLTGRRQYRG